VIDLLSLSHDSSLGVATIVIVAEVMSSVDLIAEGLEGMSEDTTEAMAMREEAMKGAVDMTIKEEIAVVIVTKALALVMELTIITIEEVGAVAGTAEDTTPETSDTLPERMTDTTTNPVTDTNYNCTSQGTGDWSGTRGWQHGLKFFIQPFRHHFRINQSWVSTS
jgi:hypothetical protein